MPERRYRPFAHLLVQLGTKTEKIFTVGLGELTVIEVNSAAPPVGSVLVAKQPCADMTEIGVAILGSIADDVAVIPAPAAGSDFASVFALCPFGDLDAEPIQVATDQVSPVLLPRCRSPPTRQLTKSSSRRGRVSRGDLRSRTAP